VAVLPVAAGISGAGALEPERFSDGFHMANAIAAALCVAGGLLSWAYIRSPEPEPAAPAERALPEAAEVVPVAAARPAAAAGQPEGRYPMSCPLSGPPQGHHPRRAAAPRGG
jgi:hypothetical protein